MFEIFFNSVFVSNMIFSSFLGLCSYFAHSKNIKSAYGLGLAVTTVLTIATPINYLIYNFILKKGALSFIAPNFAEVDLSYLKLIVVIVVIASVVQVLEIVIEKRFEQLYNTLGVFLPLITVNCAILGATLFMFEKRYSVFDSAIYGFSAGIGWLLAIMILAFLRKKIRNSDFPEGLSGVAIIFIITGIVAMIFTIFPSLDFNRKVMNSSLPYLIEGNK